MSEKIKFESLNYNSEFFNKIIKNSSIYYAHTNGTNKELLSEHSSLVVKYSLTLIKEFNIEKIIDNLISEFLKNINEQENIDIFNYIKETFILNIAYHDFGKVNYKFQNDKMQNYNSNLSEIKHDIDSQHSILSYYIFILHQSVKAKNLKLPDSLDLLNLSFGYNILKHHSCDLDNMVNDLEKKHINLTDFIKLFDININDDFIKDINEYVINEPKKTSDNFFGYYNNDFSLFALIKLNYSLLTASDYCATNHYISNLKNMPSDFGILNKDKMIENIKKTKSYNKKLYDNIDNFKYICPKLKNNGNLNQLRTEMGADVIQNIKNNSDKNLFYIEAPPGGGKTNLSMIAISELLSLYPSIKNIFYVFPFTTLITQTYKILIETFGLDKNEIIQIHSKAGLQNKNETDNYSQNYIDYLFVNFPIVLLTHIKFFDILKSNKKEENYILHRLCNSIVIIDELQSYNPSEWDKIMYLIDNYSKLFNIKFIIMSATLPKIGNLTNSTFVHLIENKSKYFLNENFKDRVSFDFTEYDKKEVTKENKPIFLSKLADTVLCKSKEWFKINKRVHTIIEFIFKKTATDFYNIVENLNKDKFFDEIFVLSGTILEPRRIEIIEYLKNEDNNDKNILLITTQVVENGVDIDMDLGFKDRSIVDSDEQLAGRINRNVNKNNCKLYLFNCEKI